MDNFSVYKLEEHEKEVPINFKFYSLLALKAVYIVNVFLPYQVQDLEREICSSLSCIHLHLIWVLGYSYLLQKYPCVIQLAN